MRWLRDNQLAGALGLVGVGLLVAASVVSLYTQTWDWFLGTVIFIILLGVIALAVEGVVRLVHPHRPGWECPVCRYDRRGNLPGPCPECGWIGDFTLRKETQKSPES